MNSTQFVESVKESVAILHILRPVERGCPEAVWPNAQSPGLSHFPVWVPTALETHTLHHIQCFEAYSQTFLPKDEVETQCCQGKVPVSYPCLVAESEFKSRINSVHFSCPVVSDSLWPHGLQHTRLPSPSQTTRTFSNSCPSSKWCHPTILSSVIPFSSYLQSFPASASIFQWVSSLYQVARVLEFQLQHQSFQWIFRTDFI